MFVPMMLWMLLMLLRLVLIMWMMRIGGRVGGAGVGVVGVWRGKGPVLRLTNPSVSNQFVLPRKLLAAILSEEEGP